MDNDLNKPKQINRVATPIKVDTNGNKIEETPQVVEVKKEEKVVEEHDSTTAVFVVVLLIILAFLVAFIFLYIVPKYLDANDRKYEYNDATTTTSVFVNNSFEQYTLSDSVYINQAGVFNVGNIINLSLENNGTNLDIVVAGKKIVSADYLLPKLAIVDDILVFVVQNKDVRTTKLFAVDKDGEVVYELYNIRNNDGMVLLPDVSSIIFNNVSVVVMTSRVEGINLILDNTYGVKTGINLCSSDALLKHKIGDNFAAIASYSFEYLGNKKFSNPTIIHSTSIIDYKNQKNLCK